MTERINARGEAATSLEQSSAATSSAQSSLADSEAKYRSLFETMDQGFCIIEIIVDHADRPIDYRFLETNPAFVGQTGLADANGRTARELVPTLEQHWFDLYGKVGLTGESIRFENGSEPMQRWFDVYAFRIGDPALRRVALLFTDITAAKKANSEREAALQSLDLERTRLAEIFRQSPTFHAVLRGSEHRFLSANDAYVRAVGGRDVVGRTVVEALPEVADQGVIDLLDRVFTTGEPFIGREIPLEIAQSAGAKLELRYLDFQYHPFMENARDGSTHITGVMVHGVDITEQVRARQVVESMLRERNVALDAERAARRDAEEARVNAEQANRGKADFLAMMSHELRTPLNAIGGYAELLEIGVHGPVTPAQRQALERIQRSQRHLLGLINGVLNYAKVDAGAVEYLIGHVPLIEILPACEALMTPQIRSKGLRFDTMACASAPPVNADREKLQQILLNLLSNAVKFTDAGGSISLHCERRAQVVAIEVRDTGRGIDAAQIERVFQPFVQIDASLTRAQEGTGLGLAISRDLARGMNGDLTATSELGVGSSFRLTLPASD